MSVSQTSDDTEHLSRQAKVECTVCCSPMSVVYVQNYFSLNKNAFQYDANYPLCTVLEGTPLDRKHPSKQRPIPLDREPPRQRQPGQEVTSYRDPPRGQTDACENITLPQTSLRVVKRTGNDCTGKWVWQSPVNWARSVYSLQKTQEHSREHKTGVLSHVACTCDE